MIKGFLFILLSTTILCACIHQENAKTVRVEVKIAGVEMSVTDLLITRNGPYTMYDDVKFSGYLVAYYKNGQLKSKIGYHRGEREGEALKYYGNGALKEKRFYWSNNKHGHHQGWWPDGQPKFDYHFNNGLPEGELKEWFASGQLYRHFNYNNGKEDGSQKMWEASGRIRANYVVKNGHRYGLVGLKNCKSVSNEKGVFRAVSY